MKKFLACISVAFCLLTAQADGCGDFVRGVDMGWLTEMEHNGHYLYDSLGVRTEGTALMKQYGIGAARFRVWVNPARHGNWCSKEDVLDKALRAKALGMDIMLDFHYSDWWADPGKQNIPEAWSGFTAEQAAEAVVAHTREVLLFLKAYGVTPRWVQVGNETTHGFLWSVRTDPQTGWPLPDSLGNNVITEDIARAETHPEAYARIFRAGCDAVKSVCPDAAVIVHLDDGFDAALYRWNLDILRRGGARFDMVGMSLYPYWALEGKKRATAAQAIADCVDNVRKVAERYGCDVMIVETGMDALAPEEGYAQLKRILHDMRTQTGGRCRGVFYWEPQCRPSQYRLGAFDEAGRPTKIMQAFGEDARLHP